MTKAQLRKQYLQERIQIPTKERLRLDDLMLLQFQQFDYSEVATVFTYWPMAHTAEPNTHLFNGYLRHVVPGLQFCYPVCNMDNLCMQAVGIDEDTVYRSNEYGIMQPKTGAVIPPKQIDLVLVPLIVADARGYRVGYGKGFYDKFLCECRKDVVTFGFSYFEPVAKIADIAAFDIPLNFLITPNLVHEF